MPTLHRRNVILVSLLSLCFVAAAQADYLGGITFSQPVPSFMPAVQEVNVSIDYKIDEAGGGRIFVVPYTHGSPSPGYAISPSGIVPAGSGTLTRHFRIYTGSAVVDQVQLTVVSPDQSQTWVEGFLPVYYAYAPDGVFNVAPDRTQGSALRHGQSVLVAFDYASSDAAGCRIFARPYYHGAIVPGYSASGSSTLPQTGSATQSFSFAADADISDIHFTITNHNNTAVLREFDVPYELHWRAIGIYNIHFNRDYESSLANTQSITATFTLDHASAGGGRVWASCTTDGVYTPGSVYEGSVLEAAGAHVVSRYCMVQAGEQDVDHIRVHAEAGTLETTLMIPVRLHWGAHAIQNIVFTPSSPALLTNGEHLNMTFAYLTTESGGARVYVRPALDYELLFGISSAGSPLYPAPSGTGDFWLTFASGDHIADSMRFLMTNAGQTTDLLSYFKHGQWAWGNPVTITPVPEADVVAAAQLGVVRPNPFNPVATVPLDLAADATVRLAVYDVRGRLVRVLADGPLAAGHHDLRFDGTDLASGTYVCRLEGPGGAQTQRMTLMK